MKLILQSVAVSEQYFVTASWVLDAHREPLFPQIMMRSQTTWTHIVYILKSFLMSKLKLSFISLYLSYLHTSLLHSHWSKYTTSSSDSLCSFIDSNVKIRRGCINLSNKMKDSLFQFLVFVWLGGKEFLILPIAWKSNIA